MLEAGACGCRSPEARLSLEAGACVLVPRGQTCWRLGLACVGAQRPDMLEAGACVRWCPEDNQTDKQTDRQTDRDRETSRQTDSAIPLATTWAEQFYVLVSDGLADRKGHPAPRGAAPRGDPAHVKQ